MNIKLGIIIPTYDSLDTLQVLIKNIFDYTDGDYQIYVVEDGQKQETIDWLETQDKIKKIYHKENKGVAPSWNDGIKVAEEDGCTHFAIFNDDIEIPENWWKDCRIKFDGSVHLVTHVSDVKTRYIFISLHISGWFFIIDKFCLEKIGYFDEQFAPFCSEDDDYFERYKQSGMKRAIVNIDIFHHGSKTLKKLDHNLFITTKKENWRKYRQKYPLKKIPGI